MANNQNPHPEPDFHPPIDYKDEPPPVIKGDENEGEGSRSADEQYREGVKKTLNRRNVEQDAKKAKEALEDPEQRKELEDAEEAARKGQIH